MKDEATHLAMEMIKSGLIHYNPRLATMRYMHQNMKTHGATTILKHMIFESRIFQFAKTPNGRIAVLAKDAMKTQLRGMSPDLTDNIIMLCGVTCYDCYRMLRDDTGMVKRTMDTNDMLNMLNINDDEFAMKKERVNRSTRIQRIMNKLCI
jgi:hypothetical protein